MCVCVATHFIRKRLGCLCTCYNEAAKHSPSYHQSYYQRILVNCGVPPVITTALGAIKERHTSVRDSRVIPVFEILGEKSPVLIRRSARFLRALKEHVVCKLLPTPKNQNESDQQNKIQCFFVAMVIHGCLCPLVEFRHTSHNTSHCA